MPRFAEPIPNVTVSVGRDALLACVVDNLRGFKVNNHLSTFMIFFHYFSLDVGLKCFTTFDSKNVFQFLNLYNATNSTKSMRLNTQISVDQKSNYVFIGKL